MLDLTPWWNFCLILGGAGGALIGLQFVVMTLIADRPHRRMAEAGAAFGTPTIVHFSVTVLLSAFLSLPWPSLGPLAITWGTVGLSGFFYVLVIAFRMRRQKAYKPVLYDWLFHFLIPLAAYGFLFMSSLASSRCGIESLYGVAVSGLLILFVGIHNAWDAVTYHVLVTRAHEMKSQPGLQSEK
jgi:hypothetical protein